MSHKLPVLAAAILLLTTPCSLTAEEESTNPITEQTVFDPFTAKIIGNRVRMRAQPHLEGHVVKETETGEIVAVTNQNNEFYGVTAPKGTKGYVFRTFVLDDVVEGSRVNVRLYPDIEAPIIGRLNTGDHVTSIVSDVNNKWLAIDLPESCPFYIACEYLEKIGPAELFAQIEVRRNEASHHLASALLYAQSEIHKPFEEIDLASITKKFETLATHYADLDTVTKKAQEAAELAQETYIQKKIAFLECKADRSTASLRPVEAPPFQQLVEVEKKETAQEVVEATDKMLIWEPLEESLYHIWAVSHEEESMNDFYEEEALTSQVITGFIEAYNRPVQNRPGDFIIKSDNRPVAFLYSTKVDLQNLIGQKVSVIASSRPNNNFAFPAFFVHSAE